MNSSSSAPTLPDGVWHADRFRQTAIGGTVSSGQSLLDSQLPGGGWPLGALIDLAPASNATPWSTLLAPSLASRAKAQGSMVAFVQPPHEPYLPALAAFGLAPERVLWLCATTQADCLWLAEQALKSAAVAAVVAWLPQARSAELRRLHWAAARRAEVLFFALRAGARSTAGCAPLSLALDGMKTTDSAARLRVTILKRRGPSLAAPLELPAFAPPLDTLLTLERFDAARPAGAAVLPFPSTGRGFHAMEEGGRALDRLAVAV